MATTNTLSGFSVSIDPNNKWVLTTAPNTNGALVGGNNNNYTWPNTTGTGTGYGYDNIIKPQHMPVYSKYMGLDGLIIGIDIFSNILKLKKPFVLPDDSMVHKRCLIFDYLPAIYCGVEHLLSSKLFIFYIDINNISEDMYNTNLNKFFNGFNFQEAKSSINLISVDNDENKRKFNALEDMMKLMCIQLIIEEEN